MIPHPHASLAHCRAKLAANANAQPLDVVKTKSVLQTLGHYEAPAWGVSPYPDAALFDAIKAFQKTQGLKADGVINPGGETEAALSQALTPHRATTALHATAQALQALGRGGDEILAHITPDEAQLLDAVTDGGSINPQTGLVEFKYGGSGSRGTREAERNRDQNTSSNDDDSDNDGDDLGWGANDSSSDAYSSAHGTSGGTDGHDGFGGGENNRSGTSSSGVGLNASESLNASGTTDGALDKDEGKSAAQQNRHRGAVVDSSVTGSLLDTKEEEDDENQQGVRQGKGNPDEDGKLKDDAKAQAEEEKQRKEYLNELSKAKGWEKFKLGTQYGYKNWTSSRINDPKETQDLIRAITGKSYVRPSGFDKNLGQTVGYNDFLKGGIYGPYEGEPNVKDPNYNQRRAEYNRRQTIKNKPASQRAVGAWTKGVGPYSMRHATEPQARVPTGSNLLETKEEATAQRMTEIIYKDNWANPMIGGSWNLTNITEAKDGKLWAEEFVGLDPRDEPKKDVSQIALEEPNYYRNVSEAFAAMGYGKFQRVKSLPRSPQRVENTPLDPDYDWAAEKHALFAGSVPELRQTFDNFEKQTAFDPDVRMRMPESLRSYVDAYQTRYHSTYGNHELERRRNAHVAGMLAAGPLIAEDEKSDITVERVQPAQVYDPELAKKALGDVWQGQIADMVANVDGIETYELQLAGPQAEVAFAGVLAERRFGKNNVFQGKLGSTIQALKNNGHARLASKLTNLRGDISFNKSWNPMSMSDDEIREDMWSANQMASVYGAIAAMPKMNVAGKLAEVMSILYSDHVDRLEKEINRRKGFEYYD